MKLEDYVKQLNAVVENADNAPNIVGEIIEALKTDLTALETASEKNEENEKRIRDLQDTNMKLFLAQVSPRSYDKEEEELTGDAFVDKFFEEVEF